MDKMKVIAGVLIMIALAGLPAGVQAEGADDGLVAEWHFDEGSGSVLVDSSGNGNDGVIHGATWVEGKYGKALSFDGVDDYADVDETDFKTLTKGTISWWVKGDRRNAGQIVAIGDSDASSYFVFGSYDGYYGMRYMKSGTDIYKGRTSVPISDSIWHHYVFTVGSFGNKIYIDGVQKSITYDLGSSSNMQFFTDNSANWDNLQVGGRNSHSSPGGYFKGIIDEVHVYNRALTAEEIKQHYEEKQTAISLTKFAAPHSIKQGQTTTVTLTVKNTGTTEITDIEVADTIPTDLFLVSGETSKKYTSLRPKDSREFQYVLQPSDVGTFNLDPATATYADEERNYHTSKSSTVAIEVIPSTGTTPAQVIPAHRATTALSIAKSPSLKSIRQFGETVITLSIENSGTTDATDIEISDRVHPSFDLTSGDFPNPKRYDLIRPGETRDLQYTITGKESGTFTLDPATVTYADEDGNIQEAKSEPASVKVIPSTEGGTSSGTSRSNPSVTTASVQLHGEKTNVVLGEDILLKLSAVNLITKPAMHVQVIIIPPSGMSVTSSAFAKSGAGQYTTTYELEPGSGKDIEVAIRSNQVGEFDVNGRIIYYFGDDREDAEDHTLTLPITVRAEPEQTVDTSGSEEKGSSTPGFAAVVAVIGLLTAYLRRIQI